MISLIQSIVDTLVNVVSLVFNLIESLIYFIGNIPTFVSYLLSGVALLPAVYIPFATAFISVSVVLFVIGRKSA